MAERGLSVDHVTIWRWVQHYAPLLNQRIRREMRHPNRFWRVDETYVKVAGSWAYLSLRRDHRVHVVTQTGPDRGEVVPAPRIVRWRSPATRDQRRWASGLRQRDRRTPAVRRTRPALSLPNSALSEQHHRAGPSVHQEADYGEPRVQIGGGCLPNDRGLRGDARSPQRSGPQVAKGDAVAQREFIHTIFGVAA